MYIERAFTHRDQFFAAIAEAVSTLPAGVISVTPTLGTDWAGESAVFFEVILADDAVPRDKLLEFTKQISWAIVMQVRPLEEWGVLYYFDFLTQAEKSRIKEPSWA